MRANTKVCLLASIGWVAAGCSERHPEGARPSEIGESVQGVISDQVHSGGQVGFWWLPDLVPQPVLQGEFDSTQRPAVQINLLGTDGHTVIDPPIAVFPFQERPDENDCREAAATDPDDPGACLERPFHKVTNQGEYYQLSWHTERYRLEVGRFYRASVMINGRQTGFLDIDIVQSTAQARRVDATQYVPLVKNRTLPLKWFMNVCGSVFCADPDQCHTRGTCDYHTGQCSTPALADGAACTDGNACTQGDTCQAGLCTGASPVTCAASDQCHVAGTCDPATGTCSNPAAADGASCSDGNACTQSDTCQAGSCVGASPVTCTASDQCHVAGMCDPATGMCSNPAATDGTACSDGNACTQSDTCQAGLCTGASPVTCAASDQCHVAGTCDPSTGACSNPAKADGAACSDGNACTQSDTCQSGLCTGASPVTCAASDQCHVAGTCDPATGACSNPAAADGTTCSDGNACTQSDTCQAGACTGGSPVTCAATDLCHTAGACDPATGACDNPAVACAQPTAPCRVAACDPASGCTEVVAPDGTACDDGNACTQTDTCLGGVCAGAGRTIADQRPLAWYRLGDSGQPVAHDASGHGYDGTYYGDPTIVAGVTSDGDGALRISPSGAADFMGVQLPIGRTFSISLWVRSAQPLWNTGNWMATAISSGGFVIRPRAGEKRVSFLVSTPTQGFITVANVTPADITEWHQYALTADGTTAVVYLDGALVSSTPAPRTTAPTPMPIWFGTDNGPPPNTRYGDATLDEIAIFDRALTAAEVAAQFARSCDDRSVCTGDACSPAAGCLHPLAPDGTACNDGNACTLVDACASGTCAGTSAITCPTDNPCREQAACDPGTGTCGIGAPKPDGTACSDDHDACTSDLCQSGTCAHPATNDPPPAIASIALPATAAAGDTLTCAVSVTAGCPAAPVTRYAWSANGATVEGATAPTLSTSALAPGAVVTCTATVDDGVHTVSATSNPATLFSHRPTLTGVTVTFQSPDGRPTILAAYTCSAQASDADGDPLVTRYAWQADGAPIAGATGPTLDGALVRKGQRLTCTVTVADAASEVSVTSAGVLVRSVPPVIAAASLTDANVCEDFTCHVTGVQDADGDAVTVHYRWLYNGLDLYWDDPVLPSAEGTPGDTLACAAYAEDGTVEDGVLLTGAEARSETVLLFQPTPVIEARITPAGGATAGEVLTCAATYVNRCYDSDRVTLAWQVNGVTRQTESHLDWVSPTSTFSTAGLVPGDRIACQATASAFGLTGTGTSNEVYIATMSWTITANIPNGHAGDAVAVIDDLNGDGFREIAIGAANTTPWPLASRAGAIYLLDGRDDTPSSLLAEVVAGNQEGGLYATGDHGGFDLATMACEPHTYYPPFNGHPGCPLVHDVGKDIIVDISGPDGAGLGFQLAYTGDLDGDGLGDLVASAPYDQVSQIWTGRTWVLSGRSLYARPFDDANLGVAGYVFDGECGRRRSLDLTATRETGSNGDLAGWRVVPIGDANGDGLGDFAVSAPNNGDFDEGTVYVVFGRADGAPVNAADIFARGCKLEGRQETGPKSGTAGYAAYFPNQPQTDNVPPRWGRLLAPAGDFNGDGYDDFLVATHGAESLLNSAFVVLGGPNRGPLAIGARNLATQWQINLGNFNCSSTGTGPLVCHGLLGAGFPSGGGGDVNGDGYDDLVFNARDYDRIGFLNVLYGRADDDGLLTLNDTIDGSGRGFEVGGSSNLDSESGVARVIGDMNGDGYDEIALGVSFEANTTTGGTRGVFVVFGSATPPSGLTLTNLRAGQGGFTVEPTTRGTRLGSSIDSGDINGDGFADLVFGASGAPGSGGEAEAGSAQVVFGRAFSNTIAFRGTPDADQYTGTPAGESILGGRGNDTLRGNGGADVIYGGAGDDTIQVDDGSFRRVNGGLGNDTLILGDGVGNLSVTGSRKRRVQEIDAIVMHNQTLTLSKVGLVAITGATHRLTLSGSGSVVLQASDHWKKIGSFVSAGVTYNVLRDGQVSLYLSTGLSTTIPPTVFDTPLVVAENTANGTTAGTLSATDPDGDDSRITWELVSDPTGAFSLTSNGRLMVADGSRLDFEAPTFPAGVVVRATDQTGLSTTASFTVGLSDQPEPPRFANAPYWSFNEGVVGYLGNVAATDPDAGDTVMYTIYPTSDTFVVDPVTGDLSLAPLAGFDAVGNPHPAVEVTATDSTGRTDTVIVLIDVIAADPLTRSAHVTFELRNWSIWQDRTGTAFRGFDIPGFTPEQVASNCVEPPTGEGSYAETYNPGGFFLDAFGNATPLNYKATTSGKLCTTGNFNYSSGTVNATLPYDVTFTYPERITPGTSFTLESTVLASTGGASVWGTTAGLTASANATFVDYSAKFELCGPTGFSRECRTMFDVTRVNGTAGTSIGLPPVQWTSSTVDPPTDYAMSFATPAPVASSSRNLNLSFNGLLDVLFRTLGLPPRAARYTAPFGDMVTAFDYAVVKASGGLEMASEWSFQLDSGYVFGELVLEDGTVRTFRLGDPTTIDVPAGADRDGDGRIDVRINLSLDANFHNTWTHTERGGFQYTIGTGRYEVLDALGNVLARHGAGPVLYSWCFAATPLGLAGEGCFESTRTDHFDFGLNGFNTPSIEGSFTVQPPQ